WRPARASARCNGRSTRLRPWARRIRSARAVRVAGRPRPRRDSRQACYSPPCCRVTRMNSHIHREKIMTPRTAEIIQEYGPFPGIDAIHGVSYDGRQVWLATGDRLSALDPASGKVLRAIETSADAGTAFDGRHLFQVAGDRIQRIDPASGEVLATIAAPEGNNSGL